MSDVVEAVHPVPVLTLPRRGKRARWCLERASTPVELPRVAESAVEPLGEVAFDGDKANVGIVRIEGRAFVEVDARRDGARFRDLRAVLASPGGGYRNLQLASTLLAATPALAMPLGIDGDLAARGGAYEDYRGEPPPAPGSRRVVEDLADLARAALRSFVARNVRVAGTRAFVDAGGPLVAPVEGVAHDFLVRWAPRGIASMSLVRLAPGDVPAYAEATGRRTRGWEPPPAGIPPGDGLAGDLAFLNAAPGTLLEIVAHHLRRERRLPGSVPEDAVAAFEALARPAVLGSAGLLGEDDLAAVGALLDEACGWNRSLRRPAGRADAVEAVGENAAQLRLDLDRWILPRILAHRARHDAEDAAFLPGPPGPR